MARPRSELDAILSAIPGVTEAYFQAPSSGMSAPYIVYEPGVRNDTSFADNVKYLLKKGYSVVVVDRNPDSLIPDHVENLPHTEFVRYYRVNGLHHFAFQLFF